jgi:hypothetical protein
MSKSKEQKPGYGKILDAWVPSEDAGEPVGCVATSFTFSPVLFEEECLGRFLQLETNANEDGPFYLVEREEKLAQLSCAAALVDQHHARGTRSLRWDLLPARLPDKILHAKVSLLLWSSLARLIVTSANLTEDGYRRNHEIFGILDYFEGSGNPLVVLDEIIEFLREAVRYADTLEGTISPATDRWNKFLDHVEAITRQWGLSETTRGLKNGRVFAVITGPGRLSAFDQLKDKWPDTSPPDAAFVVSPFFDPDPPEAQNAPSRELWSLLKKRGEASIEFQVTAEEMPGDKAILLHAPESLNCSQPPNRDQIHTDWKQIVLEEGRPLHAKCLWLKNDNIALHMMGSSNFTSAGLGIGEKKNLEVNLAYSVRQSNKRIFDALFHAWLPEKEISEDLEKKWLPNRDEGEDSALSGLLILPKAFNHACYGHDEQKQGFIEFTFSKSPPSGWALFPENDDKRFLTESFWKEQGSPILMRLQWQLEHPPSGFKVCWNDSGGRAWWPVNVLTSGDLPPPDELKNLPLDVLIEILTSAKPLHQAMRRWLRQQRDKSSHTDALSLDPHKRVDTSSFLLQRMRRVSDALQAIRQRLEHPFVSEQSIIWRLKGPVGVMALAQAIGKEAHSEQERYFLLTELCLELNRVKPQTISGCILSLNAIHKAIRDVIQKIRENISPDVMGDMPALADYIKSALEEVMR